MPQHRVALPSISVVVPPLSDITSNSSKLTKLHQCRSPNVSPLPSKDSDVLSFPKVEVGEPTTPSLQQPTTTKRASLLRSRAEAQTPSQQQNDNVTVLCDDAVRHVMTFGDWETALNLRAVNAAGSEIVTSFDFYWHYESLRIKQLEELPKTVSSFAEFVELCKVVKHRQYWDRLTLAKFKRYDPVYKLTRIIYGGICPFLFAIGIVLVTILFPLFLDGVVTSPFVMALTSIPVFLCAIVPYFVMALGVTIDALLMQPWRERLLSKLENRTRRIAYYFDRKPTEDLQARFVSLLSIWQLMGIPICIASVYVKYMTESVPLSVFCMIQYIVTIVYTLLPLFIYIATKNSLMYEDRSTKTRVIATIAFTHAHGILLNLTISIQLALISAKLDGYVSFAWYYVFIPTWIYMTFNLIAASIYTGLFLVHKCTKSPVNSLLLLMYAIFCGIVCGVGLAMVVISLRLEEVLKLAYFIVSIPLLFGSMILIPISLLTGLICCYFTLQKRKQNHPY